MIEPHILLQVERISRIAKYLPRDDLEKFVLTLAQNFLERENVYAKWIESLKSASKPHG